MSYDSDVINATSGRGEANWDQIIKLCNRIRDSVGPTSMAQAMGSVLKRVKHSDPNVQLHALTLLEACVSNCGKSFQSELTKSPFQSDFKAIITGSYADPRVTQRCKELLVSWANEFKGDSSMSGLLKFVEQLRKDGISFQGLQQSNTPAPTSQPTASSNEDEDLRRAIQMSLRDSNPTPAATTSSSLYPSMPARTSPTPAKKVKKVRAIYDFEAAEDNELSFRAGEIVTVVDDSDENWWGGETQLGTGLFPASFVSTNLSVDPEPSQQEVKTKKKSKGKSKSSKSKSKGAEINTDKIGLLLDMIKGADVTSEENLAENETLLELEEECKKMRPVVGQNIAALQRQEDKMQEINQKFEDALATYRKLLAEGPRLGTTVNPQSQPSPAAHRPQHQQQQQMQQQQMQAKPAVSTTQQFLPAQYSLSPQQQQQQQQPQQQPLSSLPSQQLSTTAAPNPPPYFPPSSHATAAALGGVAVGTSQQPGSLAQPPPHSMQLSMPYQASTAVDPNTASSLLPANTSLESIRLQGQPAQPLGQSATLYSQQQQQQPAQVVGMSMSMPSLSTMPTLTVPPPALTASPPSYHPHASLYQPLQQPLL